MFKTIFLLLILNLCTTTSLIAIPQDDEEFLKKHKEFIRSIYNKKYEEEFPGTKLITKTENHDKISILRTFVKSENSNHTQEVYNVRSDQFTIKDKKICRSPFRI